MPDFRIRKFPHLHSHIINPRILVIVHQRVREAQKHIAMELCCRANGLEEKCTESARDTNTCPLHSSRTILTPSRIRALMRSKFIGCLTKVLYPSSLMGFKNTLPYRCSAILFQIIMVVFRHILFFSSIRFLYASSEGMSVPSCSGALFK